MRKKKISTLTLAFCIALFPPIWAVLAPYIGIKVGAVALICAGVYVTNGNNTKDALRMTIGFLLGDIWAIIALSIMNAIKLQKDFVMFCTLFILGGLAVLIADKFEKIIFSPSLLSGWAIGLTVMSSISNEFLLSWGIQIAVAMVVGVLFVGVFVEYIHQKLTNKFSR